MRQYAFVDLHSYTGTGTRVNKSALTHMHTHADIHMYVHVFTRDTYTGPNKFTHLFLCNDQNTETNYLLTSLPLFPISPHRRKHIVM
jgi:hypothetical protein